MSPKVLAAIKDHPGAVIFCDGLPEPLDHLPHGAGPVFGMVRETKPIRTAAPGNVTLHLCEFEFARASVEHEGDTKCYFIADMGDHWELCLEHPPGCHYRADAQFA